MSQTILLCTGALEVGLAAGWALHSFERFLYEGRLMVLSMVHALGVR